MIVKSTSVSKSDSGTRDNEDMKNNSSSTSAIEDFMPLIVGALVFGAILLVSWLTFENSQEVNRSTASTYQKKMVQVTGYTTGPWEYVSPSGEVKKTRDCGNSEDFWQGRHCAETEDGLVTFRYGTSKSSNIYRPVLIVDGKELDLHCVRLGDNFIAQRNHCGV